MTSAAEDARGLRIQASDTGAHHLVVVGHASAEQDEDRPYGRNRSDAGAQRFRMSYGAPGRHDGGRLSTFVLRKTADPQGTCDCTLYPTMPRDGSWLVVQQYDYETLGADTFQQLCQALLVKQYPDVQCFPVGMPDGGRDASSPAEQISDSAVFQVKFRKPTPNKLATADEIAKWLIDHIKGELGKVERLVAKGATSYIVMTNAQCSSHEDVGTRDRVQSWLDDNVDIPSQVWWRDDIDRRLDGETEIKRTYGFLRDVVGLAELIGAVRHGINDHETVKVARADRRVAALLKYLRHQYQRDKVVKFKQTEHEPDLLDVFVDVPAEAYRTDTVAAHAVMSVRAAAPGADESDGTLAMWEGLLTPQTQSILSVRDRSEAAPAAELLLSRDLSIIPKDDAESTHTRIVLEGAPGQGKSTVAQYICQVHRARLLGLTSEISRFPSSHISSPIRLPFHVDLRDLSAWLRKEDPFDIKNTGTPPNWGASLEAFLAAQVSRDSGDIEFKASDLDAVTSATPVLLMLDGLDEVPDFNDRKNVVNAVDEAVNRISYSCPSLMTVVTSRPSVFAKTPGFSRKAYNYLSLSDLPLQMVLQYTDGWLKSRNVPHQEAYAVRKVLGEKLGHPHIVDLARNPMQLAILLWLVKRKGPSLPDKRTALYGSYMDTFLDREAEKSSIVRDERDLILEMHGFVAWELHCQAETGQSGGRISEVKLKGLLRRYLAREGYKKPDLLEQLFTGMTLRVMVLTSRVEGTFEFEVQPLREYFAARFLYLTAQSSPPGGERRGSRSDRFEALLRNPYWWNVTRFYAGFSDKGELANVVDLLEALSEDKDFALVAYPRMAAATLLRDQVFSQGPRSAARVFDRVTSPDALALMLASRTSNEALTFGGDGGDIVQEMKGRIQKGISASGQLDLVGCRALSKNGDPAGLTSWWLDRFKSSRNVTQQKLWYVAASEMNLLRTLSDENLSYIAERISDPYLFWRRLVSDDVVFDPAEGTVAFQQMREAVRDVIVEPVFLYRAGPHFSMVIRTLSSVSLFPLSVYRRLMAQSLSMLRLTDNSGPGGQLAEEVTEALVGLYHSMRENTNNIDVWQSAYESLVRVLGSEAKQTQMFALAGGRVRTNNISREKGGRLLDEELPAVFRARYARQRRKDAEWWGTQVRSIETKQDAWFIIAAMLSYASAEMMLDHARELDQWVSEFTPEDIRGLSTAFRGRSISTDPGVGFRLPRGLSHQSRFISVLSGASDRFDEDIATAIRKAGSQREFVGLYANHQLQRFLHSPLVKVVPSLSAIKEAMRLVSRGFDPVEANYYIEHRLQPADSRKVLAEPSRMLPQHVNSADLSLMAAISEHCSPLAVIAESEGWFEEM
ncbi:NACHT domain-containing protein [Streptomyces sp. NPDC091972]|uniref:NACHT domain-containing protein n=1 Tax=Streptomyces sp. NPDC091972 TaxID=3366007 RepID=UPI00380589A5